MNAQITVDSTWLLQTFAGLATACFLAWGASLFTAYRAVINARKEAAADRKSLFQQHSHLAEEVATLTQRLSYLEGGQDKKKMILNNLRQLSAAADQFYLESGKQEAKFSDLVGPNKYIREIKPVAGERYDLLKFKQGEPLIIRLSSGEEIRGS